MRPPLRKNSARPLHRWLCCVLQNVKLVVDDAQFPAHCSMLLVKGAHIHASRFHSFPLRGAQLRPEKLIEGFLFAVLPNHNGSPVSKLLTTVMT